MSVELDKVKAKIRALAAKQVANGCTEDEAMLAARKVGDLLLAYNLSMTDVMVSQEKVIKATIDTGSKQAKGWFNATTSAINRYCGTKYWVMRRGTTMKLVFFGLENDVLTAVYLYKIVERASESSWKEFTASDVYQNAMTHRKRLTSSFLMGFGNGISKKLYEMTEAAIRDRAKADAARAAEMEGRMVNATDEALARSSVSNALSVVEASKAKRVNTAFVATGMKLRTTYGNRKVTNGSAYRSGSSAGYSTSLNKGVGGGRSKVSGLIGRL